MFQLNRFNPGKQVGTNSSEVSKQKNAIPYGYGTTLITQKITTFQHPYLATFGNCCLNSQRSKVFKNGTIKNKVKNWLIE
ncbi:MAG: hypothetical protein D3903_18680 [Candidatus Electrothrix sp. GM3_4]|nr:hypothetical protein [Candidatus Electrothrix sp. GM3_4]